MVEQLTLNQLVPGSSPGGATRFRFFPVQPWLKRSAFRRRSSMVEHLFCKQAVAGSNPIAGSIFQQLPVRVVPRHCNFFCPIV